jgi:tRNA 2-thiouridine synthesizing protein A
MNAKGTQMVSVAMSLDLRGNTCPLPIVKTARAMKDLRPGDLLEVLATDAGSVLDFVAWCRGTGNELVWRTEDRGIFRFIVRKK